jgi:hypothetical protein
LKTRLIRIIAVFAAAYFSIQAVWLDEHVPPEGRGMDAVARVFVLAYHLVDKPQVAINRTSDPPWSEALLSGGRTIDLLIKKRAGTLCTYDIGRAIVGRDNSGMTVDMDGAPIRAIAFDWLSTEITVTTERSGPFSEYRVRVFGLPGAVCHYERGKPECFNWLSALLGEDDEVRSLMRVLQFIHEHVCPAANLPF